MFKINIFTGKSRRSRLRSIIRGYRVMLRNQGFGFYRDLVCSMRDAKNLVRQDHFNEFFFIKSFAFADSAVRQFLFQRLLGQSFHNEVCLWFSTRKPIRYPLPVAWLNLVEASGIQVDRRACSLLFFVSNFLLFGKAVFLCFDILKSGNFRVDRKSSSKKYIYFSGLGENNLPRDLPAHLGGTPIDSTYDVCSWFVARYYDAERFEVVGHDVRRPLYSFKGISVKNVPYPWHLAKGLRARINIFNWFVWAACLSIFDYFRGRWWHTMFLGEALRAYSTGLIERDCLAEKYCFHFSGTHYRPLWTYSVEQSGCEVVVYFYSHYRSLLFNSTQAQGRTFDFGSLTWSKFLVWDSAQKQDLLSVSSFQGGTFETVGPVWFTDKVSPISYAENSKVVCVFPVEPHRLGCWRGISPGSEFFASFPEVHSDFILHLVHALISVDIKIVVKAKRGIGGRLNKRIKLIYETIAFYDNVVFVDPSISAFRVYKGCIGAISFPFTSAALCAPSDDFPSVYYDPTGRLSKADPASNGKSVLSGVSDLSEWVQKITR